MRWTALLLPSLIQANIEFRIPRPVEEGEWSLSFTRRQGSQEEREDVEVVAIEKSDKSAPKEDVTTEVLDTTSTADMTGDEESPKSDEIGDNEVEVQVEEERDASDKEEGSDAKEDAPEIVNAEDSEEKEVGSESTNEATGNDGIVTTESEVSQEDASEADEDGTEEVLNVGAVEAEIELDEGKADDGAAAEFDDEIIVKDDDDDTIVTTERTDQSDEEVIQPKEVVHDNKVPDEPKDNMPMQRDKTPPPLFHSSPHSHPPSPPPPPQPPQTPEDPNVTFETDIQTLSDLLAPVEPPDELDVSSGGSSMQEIVVGRFGAIVQNGVGSVVRKVGGWIQEIKRGGLGGYIEDIREGGLKHLLSREGGLKHFVSREGGLKHLVKRVGNGVGKIRGWAKKQQLKKKVGGILRKVRQIIDPAFDDDDDDEQDDENGDGENGEDIGERKNLFEGMKNRFRMNKMAQ